MIREHSQRENRSAFTLVELMVVVLIIAILVGLISSAVMKALGKIPEVQTRTEISEMGVALQAFMSDYNLAVPPPSLLILNEASPQLSPSYPFLQTVFGKNLGPTDWNGDGVIGGIWTLQGQQCLVFYLGGIPNTAAMLSGTPPAPQGFSTNNMKPSYGSMPLLGETMGKRKGPYFTFVTSRLKPVAANGGFFLYIDPWQTKSGPFYAALGGTPYAYFSSNGINNGYSITDCNGLAYTDPLGPHFAMPYWTGVTGTKLTFTYSNTYQIISAGKDGKFGYNPAFPQPNNLWVPASGAVGTGADDQANFSGSLLGAGQS